MIRAAFLALALLPAAAQATPAACLVVGITDGDTITARCGEPGSYEQVKVRIAAIDTPERGQPYGKRAAEALRDLCMHKQATIYPRTTDRYKRTVGDVECDGHDVGMHMVSRGWAWVYVKYAAPSDNPLYKGQDVAQRYRVGLWADTAPVPPWEWRNARRGQ
ncbi:MAG: thermonuclease family protein [Proteobacteria bacterium]|nr:MAG: thermonuclease family protein [Pseudomonadota bacterium]